jgi:hypothetical protein
MSLEHAIHTPSLSVDQAFKLAPMISATPAMVRMTSLDSACHLKLNALWELTFSTYQDVLRETCDVAALNARGLFGLAEYVELDVGREALTFPQRAELRTSMCTGSLQANGEGYALLGTVALRAARAGGVERLPSECGRMRILSRLVQPRAPHGQRAVRAVPAEMSRL